MGGICVFPTHNNTVINTPFAKVDGKLQAAPLVDSRGKRPPLQAGTCTAQSALWCKKMLSGAAPESSCPKELAAGILQTAFINAGNAGTGKQNRQMTALLEATGLKVKGGSLYHDVPSQVTSSVASEEGVYLIFTTRHAIAVKTGGGKFYYFEPENGLWLFAARVDFRKAIHKNYGAEVTDPEIRWMAFPLELS
jgi:hypothetical protein